MTADEYDAYRSWVIDDFADELVRNGRVRQEDASARALASLDALLPQGIDTPRQSILVADDAVDGRRIGHLWFGPSSEDEQRAWIYDVTVEEPERGRGYGRAILEMFEDEARDRGFASAGLNVFGDNEVARHLYGSLGYTEIARQMAKPLSGGGLGPSGAGT